MTQSTNTGPEGRLGDFGPNEWLVEEMYQRFLKDPSSVGSAWHDFFADYRREAPAEEQAEQAAPEAPAASAPAATRPATTAPAPTGPVLTAPVTQAPAPAAKAPTGPTPVRTAPEGATVRPLRGAASRVVANMEASLGVPTATSVRGVPAKLLADNRLVINRHLERGRGGKVSFTHLIGYALVQALADQPAMNSSFAMVDGKPAVVQPEHVNLGIAIDLQRPDGSRSLVVPSVKRADTLTFRQFWQSYEDIVRRARQNKLTMEDFAGTTLSLTNPGTIGTVHSVPRLMEGQGTIIGIGAMEYPAEYQGAAPETLTTVGVSKIITLTSTYDHRIIQGAQSGEFLRRIHQLLLGEDDFYLTVFRSMQVPYEPIRWTTDVTTTREGQIAKGSRVMELIHAYRVRGHLLADTDPLEYKVRSHPDLDIAEHGLTLWDLDRQFPVGGFAGQRMMKLRDVLTILRDAYCRRVGVEYMHIQDPEQREWIQQRVEGVQWKVNPDERASILMRLNRAEAFETFLQTKYVGQKRFSLEGGESVIPMLSEVLSNAARSGMDGVGIGMPHRGRLNVLANIVGKSSGQIFREFEGNIDPGTAHGSGDVKYHLGQHGVFTTTTGPDGAGEEVSVDVSLVSNPSHLEAVDPVLEGYVRAQQDELNKGEGGYTILPVLLHGDAAFAGQGVVAETLNLSQLRGYRTGGTVHIIVNNQVGFTTAPASARSTVYCTDAARMVQAPIFHVNGDDPEACVRVARLAFEFRQTFNKDVVVDLICYRKRGHSEVDEPSFTQPLMYNLIDAKRSVRKTYTETLIGRGDISIEQAEEALQDYQKQLEIVFQETREDARSRPPRTLLPAEFPTDRADDPEETAISRETLKRIADSQVSLPEGFTVHERLGPQLQRRAAMADDGGIDWAFAETLAFGSLLLDGHPVRMAGQDSRRGTFGQRHAVLVDRVTGVEWTPLRHLDPDQHLPFHIYDSLLSEFAAVGFEYGYALANRKALVIWEAQFGDFANGAQTIIDEFISSGEVKWEQESRLVLLLPHGYEGQGPDHSSARIERWLQLCANDNMTVALPSTPANYFHLLRRQVIGRRAKPLIVFTPKSMLRLRAAASAVSDFTEGQFQPILPDPGIDGEAIDPFGVRRLILCSGKVSYEVFAKRRALDARDTAVVRLERLYPLGRQAIQEAFAQYPNLTEIRWVQEEPENQGAWPYVGLRLPELADGLPVRRVSRPASASAAVGSIHVHEAEQAALLDSAFAE